MPVGRPCRRFAAGTKRRGRSPARLAAQGEPSQGPRPVGCLNVPLQTISGASTLIAGKNKGVRRGRFSNKSRDKQKALPYREQTRKT